VKLDRGEWVVVSALGVWLAGLCIVAVRLPLDYWDGFEFLTNARILAGQGATMSSGYSTLRPPLWALVLAPVQWFYRPYGATLWQSHLLAVVVALAAVLAAWRLFRERLGFALAAVGAAAVALNGLTVHYAPFVLADVFSMLITTLALHAWLLARSKPGGWRFPLAGALAGLGLATKFPLLLLPLSFVVFEVVQLALTRKLKPVLTPGPWLAAAACVVVFLGAWMVAGSITTPGYSLKLAVEQIRAVLAFAGDRYLDPWWELFEVLWMVLGLPFFLCIALGIVETLRARREADLLHLAWCAVYLFIMSRYVAHREARYVLPVLPSVIWLSLRGAEQLWTLAPSLRRFRWLGAAVLLAIPAYGGAREAWRFTSPPYSRPIMAQAAELAAGKPYAVVGDRAWSVFAPDPVVFPHDEYMHFHHLSAVAFEYFAGRKRGGYEVLQQPGPVAQIEIPAGWWETMNAQHLPAAPAPLTVTVRLEDGRVVQQRLGY